MAENLDYVVEGSKCYDNNPANCIKYGRLYDWATAMNLPSSCNSNSCSSQIQSPHQGICPAGWHLPSIDEWDVLMAAVGGGTAGTKLKATSGWNSYDDVSGNGTDEYGFSALPGGSLLGGSGLFDVGKNGFWWSTTEGATNAYGSGAYSRNMSYEYSDVSGKDNFKFASFSVRCIQDYDGGEQGDKGNDIGNYSTVVIGTQTWMAENLNYAVEGSKCYADPANCIKYGRLYDWATAMNLPSNCNDNSCSSQIQPKHQGICPAGWHLPSIDEWTTLADYVGDSFTAGAKLKATSGWKNGYDDVSGNGTDEYGFSALPGGGGRSDGSFYSVGESGLWCSATENNTSGAYGWDMFYMGNALSRDNGLKSYLYSVRCLKA
jgi:uncharacterized protein (TIGR02145 family)